MSPALDLQTRLDTALDIAGAAGEVALRHFNGTLSIASKDDASPVTVADQETEQYIRHRLQAHFPQDGIYGEEYGASGLDRETVWVIDPIDGTRSFIAGVPLFGLLMAMMRDDKAQIGICRLPALGQVYAAARGLGATLNGRPISVSGQTDLNRAMLFINEGEKIHTDHPHLFDRLLGAGALRRLSYDCQPHALVAAGQVDAVVDYGLKPYDYLPMIPIVQEAGGTITDWSGAPLDLTSDGRVVTAATAELHAALLDLLSHARP
ncbi:histidinol-phosphatase, inositol monophosphatase family [Roseovarius azorensis]|uniref:Inositol-1-monophosphatase n=1 Tax=Roseovarius azorensis TaxID=1287727 RepID=A0A1H7NXB7_9RHOB|nr:inositol monophosphatase family protein [Roseovarius azorensis]SEL28193.1 histidinol-phosphatase, inositol monophosphatase family [Roseovarius azorensis]